MKYCLNNSNLDQWVSLSLLTLVFVVGELSHFLLGIVSRPMSQEIQFGDQDCLANNEITSTVETSYFQKCHTANNSDSCELLGRVEGLNASACIWNYSGLGMEYQILAGPAFIAVFTISGIFIGMIADRYSRRAVVSICLLILNLATLLCGIATAFWQLVLFRMLIGAGESAFMPSCSSMISNIFDKEKQGLAMGIFTWGIYFGYGMSYVIGNFVTSANLFGLGWRASYFLSGGIGLLVSLLVLLVVKEPPRNTEDDQSNETSQMKFTDLDPSSKGLDQSKESKSIFKNLFYGETGLLCVIKGFFKPHILMLTLAACIRHTAGFTWAYNTQLYFSTYYPSYNLGIWISIISIVGGAFGVAIGGYMSDKLVVRLGLRARLYVLAASQFLASPFAVGVLYFSPPGAFFSLLGSYFFAEMWFGVLFAVMLEVFPSKIKSTSIAVFLFVMNNVGGNLPVLVEPLRNIFSYKVALLIMYPGNYLFSSILFFLSSFLIRRES